MNNIMHKIKGYFGYGVPLWVSHEHVVGHLITNFDDYFKIDFAELMADMKNGLIKLKLRRLNNLTDEEIKHLEVKLPGNFEDVRKEVIHYLKYNDYLDLPYEVIIYLHSIHIDYQDLIGQGLAVDINESNVQNMHKGE